MEVNENKLSVKSIITIILGAIILVFVTVNITLMIEHWNNGNLDLRVSIDDNQKDVLSSLFSNNDSENDDKTIQAISESLKRFRVIIDKYYKGDIDENALLDGAIKGYVEGLGDKYTTYMTKSEWDEFEESITGNFVGIGIYMMQDKDNDTVKVVSTIDGYPAEKEGILAGDYIVEVDGENVVGLDSTVISNKIKGEEGKKVKIKVLRDNEYKEFEIARELIKIYHVNSTILEDNIGYIQLYTFDEGCSSEFYDRLQELKDAGVKKLIIDLRNNTGGIVDESLNIVELFVDKDKTMLITENKDGNKKVTKSKSDKMVDMDVVLLINDYTASASEIMVGALVDNGVAKTVGTKSYGKGVIQQIFRLKDGGAFKMTTEEYYTPNENKIHQIGIEPDYEIEYENNKEKDNQLEKAIEVLNGNN